MFDHPGQAPNMPHMALPPRTPLGIDGIQCRCPAFTCMEPEEQPESKFKHGPAT